MQVVNMEWEIPIPARSTTKKSPVPLTRSKSANSIQRRLSRKGHRQMKSLQISRPIPLVPATEPVRESFIETGEYTTSGAKRDWTISQKAWWDAILLMQEEPSVVRVALEMRVMGNSNILLAPQRGNDLGTTAIEVLSTPNTPPDDWRAFCQKLATKWTGYKDGSTGNYLHARPHWCKQWSFLSLPNEKGEWMIAEEWMRRVAYKDSIPEFLEVLKKVGEKEGFSVDDLRARFGNHLLESVFWSGDVVTDDVVESGDKSRVLVNKVKKWLKKTITGWRLK